jgi:hypothetical protein
MDMRITLNLLGRLLKDASAFTLEFSVVKEVVVVEDV